MRELQHPLHRAAFRGDPHDGRQERRPARPRARPGVPITPGSDGVVETEADALKVAKKIGYPIMIKASAGGGGRGMRAAHNDVSLVQGFHAARAEAEKAFGKAGRVF